MSNDRMIYNGNLGSYEQKAAIQNANAVRYENQQYHDAAIQNANAVHYGMLPKAEGARLKADAVAGKIVGKSRRR